MIKIYHNKRCKHSRAGLQYLEGKNIDFDLRLYLQDPMSKSELIDLIQQTGKKPVDLIRKQEKYFIEHIKNKQLTDHEIIDHILNHPKLLHRPIISNGEQAVIAQPPEQMDEIL